MTCLLCSLFVSFYKSLICLAFSLKGYKGYKGYQQCLYECVRNFQCKFGVRFDAWETCTCMRICKRYPGFCILCILCIFPFRIKDLGEETKVLLCSPLYPFIKKILMNQRLIIVAKFHNFGSKFCEVLR